MQCLRVNIRRAAFIILSLVVNNISIIQMADNQVEVGSGNSKNKLSKNISDNQQTLQRKTPLPDLILQCSMNMHCTNLHPPCIECKLNTSCIYGNSITTVCTVNPIISCNGPKEFKRQLICRYCYQTEPWEHNCDLKANCNSVASPKAHYITNCTVKDDILCLGNRTFNKNVRCNWTGGYQWSTALILSITLGGFGADRFYLGHWQEGIGKLFSFGGLGVWTIIDVILISLHYLGPADGSLYI